jgi:CrcB protein
VRSPDVDPRLRPFLATGLCGGLTTFSTLQLEQVQLVRAEAWGTAAAYVVGSVVLGLSAVLAGRAAARRVRS